MYGGKGWVLWPALHWMALSRPVPPSNNGAMQIFSHPVSTTDKAYFEAAEALRILGIWMATFQLHVNKSRLCEQDYSSRGLKPFCRAFSGYTKGGVRRCRNGNNSLARCHTTPNRSNRQEEKTPTAYAQ